MTAYHWIGLALVVVTLLCLGRTIEGGGLAALTAVYGVRDALRRRRVARSARRAAERAEAAGRTLDAWADGRDEHRAAVEARTPFIDDAIDQLGEPPS